MGVFSRDGKKAGSTFLQHISTHSTQIFILVFAPKKSGEHQLGNFFCPSIHQNCILLWVTPQELTDVSFLCLVEGVTAFCGMVMASCNCPMYVENPASLITDPCTVFSWLRLKLSVLEEGIWAISALELRWKSFCRMLTTLEKWSSTNLAHIAIWLELVLYLGKLGLFSIKLLVFTFKRSVHITALMTQVTGSLMQLGSKIGWMFRSKLDLFWIWFPLLAFSQMLQKHIATKLT